jgi:2-phospho-L-lactate transferase/gluconeogenesis factor (CofD/UPF0052 family)
MNRILAVRGRVLPVSSTPLTLHARVADGSVVDGQSLIMRTSGIERVWITPDGVTPSAEALSAIAEADLIVLGPGSLFTSLLPSLLIPAIRDTILAAKRCASSSATWRRSLARRLVRPAAHVEAADDHTGPGLTDDPRQQRATARLHDWPAEPVRLRWLQASRRSRASS